MEHVDNTGQNVPSFSFHLFPMSLLQSKGTWALGKVPKSPPVKVVDKLTIGNQGKQAVHVYRYRLKELVTTPQPKILRESPNFSLPPPK